MKIIIQIPCYNEAQTLPAVFKDLPSSSQIDNYSIEYLVINDASTDDTVNVAKNLGIHHIISNNSRRGLAETFIRGVEYCLKIGADIIVNTDGDNQYKGQYIIKLVKPIIDNKFDFVVGCRAIMDIEDFSLVKKYLQLIGSGLVRMLSRTNIPDSTSGFRAFNADVALRLLVTDKYTYSLETLIQLGNTPPIRITYIPIKVNKKTRESRLIKSNINYILKSIITMTRLALFYRGFALLSYVSIIFLLPALFLSTRFLINTYYFNIENRTYLPSIILVSILLTISVTAFVLAIISYLINLNRRISQESSYMIKKLYYKR